jgi:hypothetical protein
VWRYRAEGAAGLVTRKRGRPSNHQLEPGLAEWAIALVFGVDKFAAALIQRGSSQATRAAS